MPNSRRRSLHLGDGLDEEPPVAIRKGKRDLVVHLDVVQDFGSFHFEHHRHRFHVSGDLFMGDGDVVLALSDRAHFSTCRVRLS